MAQVLKLKRTAVTGKTPTTSHLELGELAMNTFDGRIFLKKDNGTPIVTEILTTNTENFITGSLNLNGNLILTGNATIDGNLTLGGNITIGDNVADVITVTAGFSGSLIPDATAQYDLGSITKKWNNLHVVSASADYFIGDGSGLTNVITQVSEQTSVTASFSNQDEITITHGFNSRNIHVSVYDSSNQLIIPESVTLTTTNQVDVTLQSGTTGYVVVAKGGHLLSGSQPIAETATVTSSFDSQTSVTVAHNFDSKNVMVTVYDSLDSQIIPDSVTLLDNNSVKVDFVSSQTGFIVVAKGGHVVQGTTSNTTNLNGQPASYYLNYNNFTNIPSGIISGSSQLTSSYDTRYALSGSSGTSDFTQLINVPSGLVSGSSQVSFAGITNVPSGLVSSSLQITNGSGIVSGSVVTTLNGTGVFSGSSQVEFNDVNNTPFSQSATEVTTTKSIVPSTSTLDLGTITNPFRDLYLSSASLYIDGQQVISSAANTLTITTDVGQSIKILETEGDDITLQTDTGNIELKGTVEIQSGKKILDSAGTKILFGDTLGITGSIDLTGTVDGVDVAQFKTDFDILEGKTLISSSQQITDGSGLFSGSFNDVPSNPFTSASNAISTSGHFVPTVNEAYDLGSPTQRWRDLYLSGSTVFLGDTKITRTAEGDVEFRDRETDSLRRIRVDELEIGSGASARKIQVDNTGRIKFATTQNEDKTLDAFGFQGIVTSSNQLSFDEIPGIPSGLISSSFQVNLQETTNYVQGIKTRLNNEAVISGSTISGNKTFNNDVTIAGNLNVQGTTTTFDTTTFNVADNIIEINYGGSATIAGIYAKDPTAPNTISGSLLWDSTTDYWIAGQSGSESKVLVKNGDGVISGSSQVSYSELSNIPSGIVSGSSQISLSGFSTTNLSEGTNLYYTDSRVKTKLNIEGVISGSSQISLSGFSTTNLSEGTNLYYTDSRVKTKLNTESVISGSSQVDYNSIQNKPTIPTNNNQLTNGEGYITGISSGDVTTALGYTPWHAGNDGAGSGLDADTLDGVSWGNVNTDIIPSTNGTRDLGSSTNRWNTLYTSDLSLSNGIGDYTIVEGEEDLFLYNNKSGKTFKFALIEVDPNVVPAKRD